MSPDQGRPAPGTRWSRDKGESVFHSVLSTENNTKAPHRDKEDKHCGARTARVRTSGDNLLSKVHTHQLKEAAVLGTTRVGGNTVCTALQVTSAG